MLIILVHQKGCLKDSLYIVKQVFYSENLFNDYFSSCLLWSISNLQKVKSSRGGIE